MLEMSDVRCLRSVFHHVFFVIIQVPNPKTNTADKIYATGIYNENELLEVNYKMKISQNNTKTH